jgi:hypothetical protein
MAKKRTAYTVSGRKAGGSRSFGRPNHRWEAITKMDLNYDGGGARIFLALDKDKWRAVVNTVMNQQVS